MLILSLAPQLSGVALTSLLKKPSEMGPASTLWRLFKVPQTLLPSQNFGPGSPESVYIISSAHVLSLLGMFYNFLPLCSCSWYFLWLHSCFSFTLPNRSPSKMSTTIKVHFQHLILKLALQEPTKALTFFQALQDMQEVHLPPAMPAPCWAGGHSTH